MCRQEEKPKRVWQPPKASSAPEAPQPAKPPRTYEYTKIKSPEKAVHSDESASDFMRRVAPSKFSSSKPVSPVKFSPTKTGLDDKSPVKSSPTKLSPLKVSAATSAKTKFFPSPNVVSSMTVKLGDKSSPVQSRQRESAGTDSDEPTKKPVAARFAAWEQKSAEKDAKKKPASTRTTNWEQNVSLTSNVQDPAAMTELFSWFSTQIDLNFVHSCSGSSNDNNRIKWRFQGSKSCTAAAL